MNPSQRYILVYALNALEGERMRDGCVRGCPRRKSSDSAHNLRCTRVASAAAQLDELLEATKNGNR